MTVTPKSGPARSCFERSFAVADPQSGGGEGRRQTGRNGQVHRLGCRGTGPGIRGRVRTTNVGKGRHPAGADSNLQGPAARGTTEGGGRTTVWRMSPYELRRKGNAFPNGARRHCGCSNAATGQRGSGHLAVAGRHPDTEPEACRPSKQRRARKANCGWLCVCGSALEPRQHREGLRAEGQGQNRTREIRPSGIAGGPRET